MPTPLPGLLRPDGTVIVPPGVAGEVLRLLARGMVADAREHGGQPTPAARALLTALYTAAVSAAEPAAEPPGTCSVAEAATRMGCSRQWVRQLLAAGRLPGRRSGGVWLVDLPLATPQAARPDQATIAA